MDPFTVPLTVGRMGRAASQVRPPALVFGAGVEGGRGWFRVPRWRRKGVTFLGEKKSDPTEPCRSRVTFLGEKKSDPTEPRRSRVTFLGEKKVTRRNRVDRGSLSKEGTSSAQHRTDPSRSRSEGS